MVQAGDRGQQLARHRRPATATTLSSKQMAADNHTTIVGNLVEDPEIRFTNKGIAVANLRVAVTVLRTSFISAPVPAGGRWPNDRQGRPACHPTLPSRLAVSSRGADRASR